MRTTSWSGLRSDRHFKVIFYNRCVTMYTCTAGHSSRLQRRCRRPVSPHSSFSPMNDTVRLNSLRVLSSTPIKPSSTSLPYWASSFPPHSEAALDGSRDMISTRLAMGKQRYRRHPPLMRHPSRVCALSGASSPLHTRTHPMYNVPSTRLRRYRWGREEEKSISSNTYWLMQRLLWIHVLFLESLPLEGTHMLCTWNTGVSFCCGDGRSVRSQVFLWSC